MCVGLSRILGTLATPYPQLGTLATPYPQLGVNTEAIDNGAAAFDSSRALGDVWALNQIWKQLGLDRLRSVLKQRSRHRIDIEAMLRILLAWLSLSHVFLHIEVFIIE